MGQRKQDAEEPRREEPDPRRESADLHRAEEDVGYPSTIDGWARSFASVAMAAPFLVAVAWFRLGTWTEGVIDDGGPSSGAGDGRT